MKDEIKQVIDILCKLLLSEFAPGDDFDTIKEEYREKVYRALIDYSESNRSIVAFRNEFRRAMNDAFNFTALAGWVDGGGDEGMPGELQDWVNARIENELQFIDEVFVKLKQLRAEGDQDAIEQFAQDRADGYSGSLTGIYGYAKALAMQDAWGTWNVGPTDHCATCAKLDGKRHKLSWFINNGYIPQEYGSEVLECHGYKCQCEIVDDEGNVLLP